MHALSNLPQGNRFCKGGATARTRVEQVQRGTHLRQCERHLRQAPRKGGRSFLCARRQSASLQRPSRYQTESFTDALTTWQ